MSGTGERKPVVFGSRFPATAQLAAALDARSTIEVPTLHRPEGDADYSWSWAQQLDEWREDTRSDLQAGAVVVCAWPPAETTADFVDLPAIAWQTAEAELACWMTALQLGVEVCAEGGAVVLVTEMPCALDAVGRAPTVATAQGLLAFARSLALSEGRRQVRVNSITTELWTAPRRLLGSPPALDSFPGAVEPQIAGAVRSLLDDDAAGATGAVVSVDCGRSW